MVNEQGNNLHLSTDAGSLNRVTPLVKIQPARVVNIQPAPTLFLAKRVSEAAAELLQTMVHQRYRRRASVLVTSNRIIKDWGSYLGDMTMASTILDRLMHRSRLLEFEGKSYRLKEAAQRLAVKVPQSD